jgi:hypothetical protein
LHDFIKNLSNDIDEITIEELSSVKNNYTHLLWISQECTNIVNYIEKIKIKYVKIATPLVSDIENISNKYNNWSEIIKRDNITNKLSELLITNQCEINSDQFEDLADTKQCQIESSADFLLIKNKNIRNYKYIYAGKEIIIPSVFNLDDIPPSIYYYYGDDIHAKGIYTRINVNTIVEIPIFVDVISESIEMKHFTIKCTEGVNCKKWKCSFQHPGGEYKKIGHKVRCPSRPRFSNIDTFESDVNAISYEDIRLCLMYSLTDIFSSMVWCQRFDTDQTVILNDIQICDDYKDPFKK